MKHNSVIYILMKVSGSGSSSDPSFTSLLGNCEFNLLCLTLSLCNPPSSSSSYHSSYSTTRVNLFETAQSSFIVEHQCSVVVIPQFSRVAESSHNSVTVVLLVLKPRKFLYTLRCLFEISNFETLVLHTSV
jgi:hypothetical protein